MINVMEKELSGWMKDQRFKTPLHLIGTKSWVRYEGKGTCLIISPWNYPFQLAMYPVLTAFGAGNTCILKPSEFTPATNKICRNIIEDVFAPEEIAVCEGGIDVAQYLLNMEFDHIFFTGSTKVGKIVMEKAAVNLSSVSLELGGKSPVVVDEKCDARAAAQKIAWGKLVNSGQTCIAPDYLLVKGDIDKFATCMIEAIKKLYPEENWKENKNYSTIITTKHTERLKAMLDDATSKGAKVYYGGQIDIDSRIVAPTILTEVSNGMTIMQEEIFGPLLPLLKCDNTEEVIQYINGQEHALSMYIFSRDKDFIRSLSNQTYSGGICINDTLIHAGHPRLPLGGVGKSGIGKYHGRYGFEEFSHLRSVVKRNFDPGTTFFYPPYNIKKEGIVSALLKNFSKLF